MINYGFSYNDLEYFLLVFIRIGFFIFSAPFFSTKGVPRQVKVSFALFLTLIVYHITPGYQVPAYNTVIGYSILIIKEAICGLLIGIGANLCSSIVNFAGRMADMEMGLSMVQLFDPMTNETNGFAGTVYEYAVLLIMMVSYMHHFFVQALVDTFTIIPIGTASFNSENIMTTMVTFLGDYVSIAFRLCLPIVASIMILNAVLGILAKSAPQINMFSVGVQIKILCGLTIMLLTIGILPYISDFIFREMKVMVTAMVNSMH